MQSYASSERGETVLAEPPWVLAVMWIGLPVLGIGAGWLLKALAGWVASLPWAPLHGLFRLVASIPEPQATVGTLAIGGIGGLVVAVFAALENLTVTVSDSAVTLVRGDSTKEIARGSVSAVFLDGKHLVLLGRAAQELAREAYDLGADRVSEAFLAHGFPWLAGDPFKDDYRRWVEDTPDLPTGADALFKARARALSKNDGDDVAQLRSELAKLGVVVRDEKKRQFWRRAG